uniref:Uncharacterized protein n=1 Tax=Otus sunia TaxID=257818 RepID=A0A8C8BAZ3_9STRI
GCHHVPYSSLTMFLGGTQRDRDSATAYSKCLCPSSPGLAPLTQLSCTPGVVAQSPHACPPAVFVLAAPALLSLLSGPLSPLGKVELPFASCLRMIVGHQPYTQLLCGFLFASLAFQVTASLSIPFWQWFLGRFGKKTAASLGLSVSLLLGEALEQLQPCSAGAGVGVTDMSVGLSVPRSMLPDTVDDFMLRNPGCLNLEALFYSFYVFFNKFAGGLAVGISTLSLHFAGYRAGDCTYNPSVILTLKLLMAPVPISLLLVAIIIFCLHPINEERRKQMRMEMESGCLPWS